MSEREVASEGALVYLLIVRRQFVCPFEVRHCNFLLGRRARHGREGEGVQLSALFLPSFCWRYRKLQSFHLASLIGGHGLHSPGLLLRRGREEGSLPGGERFCSFRPPPPFFFPPSLPFSRHRRRYYCSTFLAVAVATRNCTREQYLAAAAAPFLRHSSLDLARRLLPSCFGSRMHLKA